MIRLHQTTDWPPAGQRLFLLDAVRAVAALAIMLHHFSLYPPLRDLAAPLIGHGLDWLQQHARTTQFFFLIGGYVMARSLPNMVWNPSQLGKFTLQRYIRLCLPYLATILLVLIAYHFARGWLPDEVLGRHVKRRQLIAHFFLLQDILGYEQLSAGFWFVCINFQLGLMYALMLCIRDAFKTRYWDIGMLVGWVIAAFSLFVFNRGSGQDIWGVYFFPYFFMGIVVHNAVQSGTIRSGFWIYQTLLGAALYIEWRWRIAVAMIAGTMLLFIERKSMSSCISWRLPRITMISRLGKISFSLFLVHFPVLVLVATWFVRCGWTAPYQAIGGLACAIVLSIVVASLFHRWVETPCIQLSRLIASGRRIQPEAAPGMA